MKTLFLNNYRLGKLITACLFITLFQACKQTNDPFININEISAWCIIGFDSLDRSPEQRIEMLNEMGLKKYGYNRGKGEYDQMKKEFKLAEENNIEITSVFVWLNAKRDSIGKLSESNEKLLNNLKDVNQKPAVWVSFNNNYFEDREDKESLKVAVEMIKYLKSRTDDLGCRLALYNHTGWFGNAQNQIEIINEINQKDISIVYNFHHAHDDIDEFKETAKLIKPYLSYVNLNGVKKDGPKILDIGKGDYENKMITYLKEEGYNGPWGILGHVKTEDVKVVLQRNLEGIKSINNTLK